MLDHDNYRFDGVRCLLRRSIHNDKILFGFRKQKEVFIRMLGFIIMVTTLMTNINDLNLQQYPVSQFSFFAGKKLFLMPNNFVVVLFFFLGALGLAQLKVDL